MNSAENASSEAIINRLDDELAQLEQKLQAKVQDIEQLKNSARNSVSRIDQLITILNKAAK